MCQHIWTQMAYNSNIRCPWTLKFDAATSFKWNYFILKVWFKKDIKISCQCTPEYRWKRKKLSLQMKCSYKKRNGCCEQDFQKVKKVPFYPRGILAHWKKVQYFSPLKVRKTHFRRRKAWLKGKLKASTLENWVL